ncbi:MAG: hypothetical protein CO108_15770 [Deltaproteobacteria bacterium CG_4_9_14_3_um_filter_63_12]|nr:MAG: hypothetical protein CO108_15770 [Deltaproteobacteria bacterium CG_4_9_14_3_um_filter_63_12]
MLESRLEFDQQDPGAAENVLRSAIEAGGKLRDRGLADTFYRRGRVRRVLKKFGPALVDFRTALEGLNLFGDGDYEPPPYLNAANIYLETARVHVQKGDIDTGLATLRMAEDMARATPNYENWADIHLELARIYLSHHDTEQANTHLNEALRAVGTSILDADLPSIYVEFAKIAVYQRDFSRADQQLQKAYDATHPTDLMRARVLLVWGDLVRMQKNAVGALWHYYRAKVVFLASSVDPSNTVVSNALEVIERRVSTGRAEKDSLYNRLQEALGDQILARNTQGIIDLVIELARLSMVFDLYGETLDLVQSTRNRLAPAAFCYALVKLAEQLDADPTEYELDYDSFVEHAPSFDPTMVDSKL